MERFGAEIQPGNPPGDYPLRHFGGSAPVRLQLLEQPEDDDARTAHTVSLMRGLIQADAAAPQVQEAARQATANARTPGEILSGIWNWIRARVQFVEDAEPARSIGAIDPASTEVLIRPRDMLTMRRPAGDCDDFAMLTASLLQAAGIPAELVSVAADPAAPEVFTHIYCVARPAGGRVVMDTSHGDAPGWEVRPAGKSKTWRLKPMPRQLGAIDWSALITTGAKATSDILTARYGVPPAGTYLQTSPQGSLTYRQPPGAAPYTFPGGGFGLTESNTGTLLLIVAAVVTLALVMRK